MITMNNTSPIEILVAEDQETDAFFLQQAFGQSKIDVNVHWVKDGQEVMNFLNKQDTYSDKPRPDLIFLDIKMPRKDGHETLGEIKGNAGFKDIPVVMVSGSQAMDDVVKAYKTGCNAYVSKSNGFEDMINFVEAVEKFWFLKARLPQQRPGT